MVYRLWVTVTHRDGAATRLRITGPRGFRTCPSSDAETCPSSDAETSNGATGKLESGLWGSQRIQRSTTVEQVSHVPTSPLPEDEHLNLLVRPYVGSATPEAPALGFNESAADNAWADWDEPSIIMSPATPAPVHRAAWHRRFGLYGWLPVSPVTTRVTAGVVIFVVGIVIGGVAWPRASGDRGTSDRAAPGAAARADPDRVSALTESNSASTSNNWSARADPSNGAADGNQTSPRVPTASPSRTVSPTLSSGVTASNDETSAYPGQCLANSGTHDDPIFRVVACGQSTWLIVARIDKHISSEAEADLVCRNSGVQYTDYHYSNWEQTPGVPDIVFCLRAA